MALIRIPAARPFSEAAVAGRSQGRPPSNFDRSAAADARIAASRWQSQNRARNLGGNSEKPWTSNANREEAARRASLAAGEFRSTRFSNIEGATDDSRRFRNFRPRPPATGQDTTDEQEDAPGVTLSYGPSLGPTTWEDLRALNHCQLLAGDEPIGVLFLLQIPEQDLDGFLLPAHRIYRADLSLPGPIEFPLEASGNSMGALEGAPAALASLHRDGVVEELEALLQLLVGR